MANNVQLPTVSLRLYLRPHPTRTRFNLLHPPLLFSWTSRPRCFGVCWGSLGTSHLLEVSPEPPHPEPTGSKVRGLYVPHMGNSNEGCWLCWSFNDCHQRPTIVTLFNEGIRWKDFSRESQLVSEYLPFCEEVVLWYYYCIITTTSFVVYKSIEIYIQSVNKVRLLL